ncbi:hypothetical protein VCHA53O466_50465 [Vibrio chagasii]|nr:hypothetical protein VCHA53O466_50465 [Vibrio chagasii]
MRSPSMNHINLKNGTITYHVTFEDKDFGKKPLSDNGVIKLAFGEHAHTSFTHISTKASAGGGTVVSFKEKKDIMRRAEQVKAIRYFVETYDSHTSTLIDELVKQSMNIVYDALSRNRCLEIPCMNEFLEQQDLCSPLSPDIVLKGVSNSLEIKAISEFNGNMLKASNFVWLKVLTFSCDFLHTLILLETSYNKSILHVNVKERIEVSLKRALSACVVLDAMH